MKIRNILLPLMLSLVWSVSHAQLFNKKARVQEVPVSCSTAPLSERPTITVSNFEVKAYGAQQRFGSELGTMLSNALVETNCFNVLASANDMSDVAADMKVSQQFGGGVSESRGVKSADYFISGQITEFNENNVGTNTLGIQIGIFKAQIGFILQIKNAQREILFSKSINVTRSKPGTGGIRLFGLPVATGSFTSKAMADALENGIIQAVNIIAEQKDALGMDKPERRTDGTVKFDAGTCDVLKSGNAPKVMVVIPEYHIQRKIPDPAGETEIIKKFVNAGFPVVDPTMYMALKTNGTLSDIVKNPVEAANIGARYGADIIIIGEAFSEATSNVNGMVSCRARVEARAINTRNATIVAADGKHGSGLDIAESVSAKVALRNAGSEIANSFMVKLCGGNSSGQGSGSNSSGSSQQLLVRNIDYGTLSTLSGIVSGLTGVDSVSKNYSKGDGTLQFKNSGSIDKIVDAIMSSSLGNSLEVDQFKEEKVILIAR